MRSRDPLSHFLRPSREGHHARDAQAQDPAPENVPEWAAFFSPAEYAEFIRLVGAYFQERGAAFSIREGLVDLPDQGSIRLGLGNLAQICNHQSRSDWPAIVAAHFDGLARARQEEEQLESLAGDFDQIKSLLAVRLFPRSHIEAIGTDRLIGREDLEGVLTALVFDMPATVRTVPPEQAAAWRRPAAELLSIGLENVWRSCRPNVRDVALDGGLVIRLLSGTNFTTATHALLLDRRPGCVGSFGSLVAVPHRHAVLCFPIEDRRVIPAVASLLPAVTAMEKEGPGSISSRLYWYRGGRFTDLPYSETPEGYRFTAPPDFVKAIEEMPPAPDASGGPDS